MTDELRRQIAAAAHTVVVKVGTRVLTRDDGALSQDRIERLCAELHAMMEAGKNVILVSSGAVGAGMNRLNLKSRPADVAQLQAVAAVGQARLMQIYDQSLQRYGRHAAQVLLTVGDFNDRNRYLNVRNTLLALQKFGAVPIINENDTVAVDELTATFGDNDRLAALVTNLIRAPLLIILSDVAGLYSGDPSLPDSRIVPTIRQLDEEVYKLVRDRKTGFSKGGMASKLEAARIVTTAGENAIIASGRDLGVLEAIMAGEPVGTLIVGQEKSVSPWKRWLGYTVRPCGRIYVDDGARRAIAENGRSLLAIGITSVDGPFDKGDLIALYDSAGREVARGLSNYSADDLEKIKGLRSEFITQVLGRFPYDEVIHRDNLAVVGK
ncbi:glutamate 5-kinase [Lignipirellula cremea]|uniref:Glutamate 5-kinase n=1 Tax=Lignipirellula cremea TaxID=2528010 RepID=A0A518DR30_9BACT|nr:glutamate 5-kinase [Lignipirellula cremea]QDU94295.1 Glutamate 5-kinase [Lignipirellula cremea]